MTDKKAPSTPKTATPGKPRTAKTRAPRRAVAPKPAKPRADALASAPTYGVWPD